MTLKSWSLILSPDAVLPLKDLGARGRINHFCEIRVYPNWNREPLICLKLEKRVFHPILGLGTQSVQRREGGAAHCHPGCETESELTALEMAFVGSPDVVRGPAVFHLTSCHLPSLGMVSWEEH